MNDKKCNVVSKKKESHDLGQESTRHSLGWTLIHAPLTLKETFQLSCNTRS